MERDKCERTFTLADGRRLGYCEVGQTDGTPILYFPGWTDSRLTRHPDDSVVADLGIRLIAIDRPGIGLSDPKPDRTYLSWVDDVSEMIDGLAIERFAVLGRSGGAPYVAACALR